MTEDDPRFIRVARGIADGGLGTESDPGFEPEDDASRAVLDRLTEIAALAAFHRTWRTERSMPGTSLRSMPPSSTPAGIDVAAPNAPPAAASEPLQPSTSEAQRRSAAESPHRPTSEPLRRWAHLELLEVIGEGVFGEVYRARETTLDREVALKLLRPGAQLATRRGGALAAHVLQEGRNLARVRHPNVVAVYGAEEHEGCVGMWMEYIRGRTLEECLREQGPFGAQEALLLGVDLCRALTAVHQAGLVHRDVKATNVMRESGGRIVLMDFGAGADQIADGGARLRGLAGTPVYLAPEILAGSPASVRSDVYSLGVLLYHLVSGRFPLERDSLEAMREAHERGEAILLREVRPDLPLAFVQVVERALATDPEARFATPGQMERALAGALSIEPGSAWATAEPAPALAARRRRRRAVVATLLFAAVATTATVAVLYRRAAGARPSLRVAVAAFTNETRDPSLDALGRMAGDWISQGLSQVGSLDVVPFTMVVQALRGSGQEPRQDQDLVRTLADETGAETAVLGTYYLDGGALQFHIQIADARTHRVVLALDPIRGSRAQPLEGVEAARERVMASLAMLASPTRRGTLRLEDRPPTYAAYEAYMAAEELFTRSDMRGAIANYERAAALDSTYVYPLLRSALAYINLGKPASAESLLDRADRVHKSVTPMDHLRVEWLRADLRADWAAAYGAVRRADELLPRTRWSYQRGVEAWRLNRPRETVRSLLRVDPHRAWLRGRLPQYYGELLTSAYHVLGDHRHELETAQRFRRDYPDHLPTLLTEMRALVGLGRLDVARAVVEQGLVLPRGQNITPADVMRVWSSELTAHGHFAAAESAIARSIAWYRERPPEESSSEANRFGLAKSLYQGRRWDEAHAMFVALADSSPDNFDYAAYLGALAVRRGDDAEALRIAARLHDWREPYFHGTNVYAEACMAALLGERERAVSMLRDAYAQGFAFNIDLHRDIDLESLRGYRPFEQLVRSKS